MARPGGPDLWRLLLDAAHHLSSGCILRRIVLNYTAVYSQLITYLVISYYYIWNYVKSDTLWKSDGAKIILKLLIYTQCDYPLIEKI